MPRKYGARPEDCKGGLVVKLRDVVPVQAEPVVGMFLSMPICGLCQLCDGAAGGSFDLEVVIEKPMGKGRYFK